MAQQRLGEALNLADHRREADILSLEQHEKGHAAAHSSRDGGEEGEGTAEAEVLRRDLQGTCLVPLPARIWGDGTGTSAATAAARTVTTGKTRKQAEVTEEPLFSDDGKKIGLFMGCTHQSALNAEGKRCIIWDDEDAGPFEQQQPAIGGRVWRRLEHPR